MEMGERGRRFYGNEAAAAPASAALSLSVCGTQPPPDQISHCITAELLAGLSAVSADGARTAR